MRPAYVFTSEMKKFSSAVNIFANGKKLNGKSIVEVMSAGIQEGDKIVIECLGDDEDAMLSMAEHLIDNRFGEI